MTDDQPNVIDEGTSAPEATAEAAPSNTPDTGIEAVLERLDKVLDKRFSGFQGLMDRKFGEVRTEVSQIRNASLSQAERDDIEAANQIQDYDKLQQENQLLRMRIDHPEAVDLMLGTMAALTLDEQVSFIESKLGKKAVEQIEAAIADAESPAPAESNPNNPGSAPVLGVASAAFGGVTDMESADAILNAASKGALGRVGRDA